MNFRLTVEFKGGQTLSAKLGTALPQVLRTNLANKMGFFAETLTELLRENAPHKSGRLGRGLRATSIVGGLHRTANDLVEIHIMYGDTPYAQILDRGGAINHPGAKAKNARAMIFQGYGYVPFATFYGHGGIRGPYSKEDNLGTPIGKFSPGEYIKRVGGGFGYHFAYDLSDLAVRSQLSEPPVAGPVYAEMTRAHVIQMKGLFFVRNTVEFMQREFIDLLNQGLFETFRQVFSGSLREAREFAKSGLGLPVQPGLVKGPGNSGGNSQASGNI